MTSESRDSAENHDSLSRPGCLSISNPAFGTSRGTPSREARGVLTGHAQGIDNAEIIEAVHGRRAPMVPVGASLRL
jgi:hypothetical protein